MSMFSLDAEIIQTLGFDYIEGANPGRPHSSNLFAKQCWVERVGSGFETNDETQFLECGFLKFKLSDTLFKKVLTFTNKETTSEINYPSVVCKGIEKEVRNNFPFLNLAVAPDAILLRSDGKGNISGDTTNGLHIDFGVSLDTVRVGINLGPIDRRVILVKESINTLLKATKLTMRDIESSYVPLYECLPNCSISTYAIKIKPGEAWINTTAERLHDGRRAVEIGDSAFTLLRGFRNGN